MPWNRFVLGFHGCDETIVEDVVCRRENLKFSRNDYDWLGNGIYFWEDSMQRALQWAKSSSRIDRPAVIGGVIDLGECLNLLDVEHLLTVADAYRTMEAACVQAGIVLPRNDGKEFKARNLDCAVIEWLHSVREKQGLKPYDTVRGFFVEGEELFPGAGLRQQDHIQLCVRNSECIVGCFVPKFDRLG